MDAKGVTTKELASTGSQGQVPWFVKEIWGLFQYAPRGSASKNYMWFEIFTTCESWANNKYNADLYFMHFSTKRFGG